MNLNMLLDEQVKLTPDNTAVIVSKSNTILSYAEFQTRIQLFSKYFLSKGINQNDNVAIKLKESENWIIAFYALLNIGANPVLIDYYFTERETLECLNISKTNLLLTDKIKNFILIIKKCEKIFIFDCNDECDFIGDNISCINEKIVSRTAQYCDFTGYNGFSNIILFTYRGFGYPLAVLFPEESLIESIFNNVKTTKVNENTVITSILPLSHIFALTASVLSMFIVGGTSVIINNKMPGEMLKSMEKYNVNLIIAVPTLINIFIAAQKKKSYDLSKCVKGMIGGNNFSKELHDKWKELTNGSELVEGYGLSETGPVICNPWTNFKTNSIGKAMEGIETMIIDTDGNEVSERKKGTLLIKKKGMFSCYLNNFIDTEMILNNGWFNTGDIVWKDKEGFFYFDKRNKDIAKIGGITVDINEIKKVIQDNYYINDVELKIEPDDIWQEKIVCNVKVKKGLDKNDFLDYLRNNLCQAKIPKEINMEYII